MTDQSTVLNNLIRTLDAIDRELITALRRSPRASMTELARLVGVARGTVYSRLAQLESTGVITGYGPEIDPARAGLDVLAFCTLEITQGTHDHTIDELSEIPEVLEIHTVTGIGDLLCQVVATSNDHLHDVLKKITALPTVQRSQSQLALHTSVHRTVADYIATLPR